MNLLSYTPATIKLATLGAILLLGSAVNSVNAGQFGVRVVDNDGLPVIGASVCFGLPGNYRQFGAVFTGADGQAAVEVPNIPFVVTVSKTRFSGVRLSEPARRFNLIKQVTLAEGRPGPRCKAGSTLADATQSSIRITQIQISSNERTVLLMPNATGEPTEYRISVTPELDSASWKKLDGSIRVSGSMAQREELYLQLRRYSDTRDGWIEARSETATVFLPRASSNL